MQTNPFEEINDRLSRIEQELIRQRTNLVSSEMLNLESPFLTVPEAAKFLGLANQTIYGLIHRKQIPCMKRQKRVYFTREQLTTWVETGRLKTHDEIAAECQPIHLKRGVHKKNEASIVNLN
jgi:excisionase family DNA binding protein